MFDNLDHAQPGQGLSMVITKTVFEYFYQTANMYKYGSR